MVVFAGPSPRCSVTTIMSTTTGLVRMLGNLLLDAAVGAVPVAGDLADVYFKAHRRNLKLLQKSLGEPYVDVVDPSPVRRR